MRHRLVVWSVLIAAIITLSALLLHGQVARPTHPGPAPQVDWIGRPVVGRYHDGGRWLTTPVLPEFELGFREDGVVVWRTKPPTASEERQP